MTPIYISANQNSINPGDYNVSYGGGGFMREATDDDLKLFQVTKSKIKTAIANTFSNGTEPDDVYFHDPTDWDNGNYASFGWTPISLYLVPINAQITNIDVKNDQMIGINEVKNTTDHSFNTNLAFHINKSNTVESSWSNTSTLSVAEEIGFNFDIFGSQTTLTYTQQWQQGGTTSQNISLGSDTAIEWELQSNHKATAQMYANVGKATLTVTYQATMGGLVFANYGSKYNGHYFYGRSIGPLLDNMGVPRTIVTQQKLDITGYIYSTTTVSDVIISPNADGKEETPYATALYLNPLVSPVGDGIAELPEGITRKVESV